MQDLTKQNEDLKRRVCPDSRTNTSQSRRNHNNNDDEAHSPKNSSKEAFEHIAQLTHNSDQMMKNMRKKLDEVNNAMKGKMVMNVDSMIKRMDLPFTTSVLECPLPPKFHLP